MLSRRQSVTLAGFLLCRHESRPSGRQGRKGSAGREMGRRVEGGLLSVELIAFRKRQVRSLRDTALMCKLHIEHF